MKQATAKLKRSFMMQLTMLDIVEALATLSDDEIAEVVKAVDQATGDWGVTRKLHAYFDKEMKKLAKMEKEDGFKVQ